MRILKVTKFSEARLGNAQDKILDGYKTRFKLTDEEGQNLHMFFSPTRVPKGLTEKEVRKVLKLYPLRDRKRREAIASDRVRKYDETAEAALKLEQSDLSPRERELYEKIVEINASPMPSFRDTVRETALPEELRPFGRMTRRNFRIGVVKFLQQLVSA